MNVYVNVGPLLQLPGSQLSECPATVTPRISARPPLGASGGASLPSMKSRTSGAAKLTKPFTPARLQSSSTMSTTPTRVGGDPSTTPPPLSPNHADPLGLLPHRNSASASRPHVRGNTRVMPIE